VEGARLAQPHLSRLFSQLNSEGKVPEGRNAMLDRKIQTDHNQDGASAVEYGLLVAGIAALVVVVVFAFGGIVKNQFKNTCTTVKNSGVSGAATC
jgi:pilus assembly protein Flp/PilA